MDNLFLLINKVDTTDLKFVRNVDELELIFRDVADAALKDIDVIPALYVALLKEYNRNRLWFAFELSVYIGQCIDETKNDIASKYYSKLQKVKNMNLDPNKKKNIISNLKSMIECCFSDKDFVTTLKEEYEIIERT
jgi:predicted AlkP superfamily pyrophosphatase or phosphodiesterase